MNKDQETTKINEFVAHAYLGMSNSHSYELQINRLGDAVRLRDTNDGQISQWVELTENGGEDNATFTCPWNGNEYRIGEFMKI